MAEENKSNEQEFKRNRPELDGVPDLSQLVYLDMPNVLHNLKHRYCKMQTKFCYTSISSILLAINPYETLPIYGQDVINEFHHAALKNRQVQGRPHPYGVSARAYMRMVQRKCNQSVIVCGESGAGKTETTKLLMRYLAMTAPISINKSSATGNGSSIEEQIIAASPILEAYGNAKTVMNNNSSRFGKFTKLLYNVPANTQQGNILGSSLETYLLEKSRVVFQAINERNYHIFYFLHRGLVGKNKVEYGLQSVESFNYTNQGQCFSAMKDVARFEELQESLNMFRIDRNVQDILWKLTMGVLNVGNINFRRSGDGFADIDKKSMKYVSIVGKLWGLNAVEFEKRLTTKSLKVGNKNIIQKIQFDNAVSNRDSIAKGIYENIFLWLCKRINAELLTENDDDAKSEEDKYFIGILDVFGFENFYFNSLEQFCINYTNEKLQQFFNFHIIASEQEEYIREGVFWKPLTIPDNKDYIQLVENQRSGFFTLLDSACTGPSKNDKEAFMQQFFKKHGKNNVLTRKTKAGSGNWRGLKPKQPKIKTRRQKFDGFMINHFADNVTYDVSQFLIKNMESVHSDTNKMIKKSNIPILKEINDKKQRRRRRKSVTSVFYSGIKRLMKSLNETEPYFVRCINPNTKKSSTVWQERIVEHQLRCGGLLEALRVLKLGYPTRVPYQLLYDKYHSSVSNVLIKNMNPEAFSTSLLIAFDVNDNDYELGLTKIFFKPSKAAILDIIMSKAGQPLTAIQNDKITRYIVDKRCKQIVGSIKVFTQLRKMVRMKRAAKQWAFSGRVASVIGGTVFKHLRMARQQIKKRKELAATVVMQTFFRAAYERRHFVRYCEKVKKSSKMIWIAYNCMRKRIEFGEKMNELVVRRQQIEQENKRNKIQVEKENIKPIIIREMETLSVEKSMEKILEEKQAKNERFREEIEQRKLEQQALQERGSIDADEMIKNEIENKKIAKEKLIIEHQKEREIQDKKMQKKHEKMKQKRKYKQNPGDTTDYESSDSEYKSDYDSSSEEEEDEEEDISIALKKFHSISTMGQLFYRHAGSRSRNKPQDRVVKVSFSADNKPFEICWGSGSRRILFSDILYISFGHWTPAFQFRKDVLSSIKCFSVVSKEKILDLEGYNEYITQLWVYGLRKLAGFNDEYCDKMAKKNLKNLLHNSKDAQRKRKNEAKKITDIMKLQQDLFIMSTHTVFRHLEEERIWNIDEGIRDRFEPRKMYPIALKKDIPWRQWQDWIREQVTKYLRENNFYQVPSQVPVQQPVIMSVPSIPATVNMAEEEKCSLM